MAVSLHERSAHQPFGNLHQAFVEQGNQLAARMCLLIMLSIARSVQWMVEQPDRSMAQLYPYLMHILSHPQVGPQRVFWWEPQRFAIGSMNGSVCYCVTVRMFSHTLTSGLWPCELGFIGPLVKIEHKMAF